MKKKVKCLCGEIIMHSDLIPHINDCEQFTERYSFFNDAIRKAVQNCENKLEQNLLLSLIYVAKRSLAKMNVDEGPIPSLPDQEYNQINNPKHIQGIHSHPNVSEKSEIKIKEEIKKQAPMEQYYDDNTIKCVKCDTIFLDLSMINYLDRCLHIICTQCLKKIVFEELPKKDTVSCPLCKSDLREIEYKSLLSEEQAMKMKREYYRNMGLVSCDCGNMVELIPGKVDYNAKNDKGQVIKKQAAEHMAKYRIRCSNCSKIFCTKCNVSPYHIGYTCEEFVNHKESYKCRFCENEMKEPGQSAIPAFSFVCNSSECQELMAQSCNKKLACGHFCRGFKNEEKCLPCLDEECVSKNPQPTLNSKADSYCTICYTTGLGNAPSILLECGHLFHIGCVLSKLKKSCPGPRITFGFCECPSCRKWISCPYNKEIQSEMIKIKELFQIIREMAVQRIKFEGLDKAPRLSDPKDRFYNKLEEYALACLSYYMCFKCKKPYFGGLKSCDNVNEGNNKFEESDLVCGKCAAVSIGSGISDCKLHGKDYIEFKCKFCCSVAQWFCWGNTHFCESCHQKQVKGDYLTQKKKDQLPKCGGKESCPLKVQHPANGEEFSLGCAICRNSQANAKDF